MEHNVYFLSTKDIVSDVARMKVQRVACTLIHFTARAVYDRFGMRFYTLHSRGPRSSKKACHFKNDEILIDYFTSTTVQYRRFKRYIILQKVDFFTSSWRNRHTYRNKFKFTD